MSALYEHEIDIKTDEEWRDAVFDNLFANRGDFPESEYGFYFMCFKGHRFNVRVDQRVMENWMAIVDTRRCSPAKVFEELVDEARRREDRRIKREERKKAGLQTAA